MHFLKTVLFAVWFGQILSISAQNVPPPTSKNSPSAIQLPQLRESTEISLITYTPGEELYQAFGHSAIRVKDDRLGIDRLYNFGTFDFGTPNFYLKFAHGDLLYQLVLSSGEDEIQMVGAYGRGVTEVPLNLSVDQKQRLFEALEINLLPENRFYQYDFVLDNCSTRIRDVFEKIIGTPIQESGAGQLTFRQMLDVYFARIPWTHFGVDLLLGSTMDRVASPREACFLPADLERAVQSSKNGDRNLAGEKRELFSPEMLPQPIWFLSPSVLFSGGGLLWFLIWLLCGRRHARQVTVLYLTVLGAVGVFVCIFSFWSQHRVVRENYNPLWLIPIHFLVGLWVFFAKPSLVRWYFRVALVAALGFLAFSFLLPQVFHSAVYPLVIVLAWRCALEMIPKIARV